MWHHPILSVRFPVGRPSHGMLGVLGLYLLGSTFRFPLSMLPPSRSQMLRVPCCSASRGTRSKQGEMKETTTTSKDEERVAGPSIGNMLTLVDDLPERPLKRSHAVMSEHSDASVRESPTDTNRGADELVEEDAAALAREPREDGRVGREEHRNDRHIVPGDGVTEARWRRSRVPLSSRVPHASTPYHPM
jgi:hypothetical protein